MGRENIRTVTVIGSAAVAGQVLHYDDFEDLFKWTGDGDGTETVAKDTAKALDGDASMKLLSDSVTPADDQYVRARVFRSLQPARRYELSFAFNMLDVSDFKSIDAGIYYHNLSQYFTNLIRLNIAANTADYRQSSAAWASIDDYALSFSDDYWNQFSMVFDVSDGSYINLTVNDQQFDLSGKSVTPQTGSYNTDAYFALIARTQGANQLQLNIDNYLVQVRE